MHQKKTHSIEEYIKGNQLRKNARWKIADGQWLFEMQQGIWASEELFDEFYPSYEYVKFNDKGTNPDKTKIK
jgi:hypothetical protein